MGDDRIIEIIDPPDLCQHGEPAAECVTCFMDNRPEVCGHGYPAGECAACDYLGDLAYDSARESRVFGRGR